MLPILHENPPTPRTLRVSGSGGCVLARWVSTLHLPGNPLSRSPHGNRAFGVTEEPFGWKSRVFRVLVCVALKQTGLQFLL